MFHEQVGELNPMTREDSVNTLNISIDMSQSTPNTSVCDSPFTDYMQSITWTDSSKLVGLNLSKDDSDFVIGGEPKTENMTQEKVPTDYVGPPVTGDTIGRCRGVC